MLRRPLPYAHLYPQRYPPAYFAVWRGDPLASGHRDGPGHPPFSNQWDIQSARSLSEARPCLALCTPKTTSSSTAGDSTSPHATGLRTASASRRGGLFIPGQSAGEHPHASMPCDQRSRPTSQRREPAVPTMRFPSHGGWGISIPPPSSPLSHPGPPLQSAGRPRQRPRGPGTTNTRINNCNHARGPWSREFVPSVAHPR